MIAAKAKEIPFQGPLLMLIIIILTNYSTENVYITEKSEKSRFDCGSSAIITCSYEGLPASVTIVTTATHSRYAY